MTLTLTCCGWLVSHAHTLSHLIPMLTSSPTHPGTRIWWSLANGDHVEDQKTRITKKTNTHNFRMVFCRNSDESKSRRGFGSLLRRHTSFNAPEAANGAGHKNGHGAAPLMTSPQDFHEYWVNYFWWWWNMMMSGQMTGLLRDTKPDHRNTIILIATRRRISLWHLFSYYIIFTKHSLFGSWATMLAIGIKERVRRYRGALSLLALCDVHTRG